jgi:hypothetical protein
MKKDTTKKQPEQQPVVPYGSFGSYQLSDEQIRRIMRTFEHDLLRDSDTDSLAGVLLVLLRSFTYTDDNSQRENMLVIAEETLMPYTGAAQDAINQLSIKTHKALLRSSVVQ